MVTGGFVMQTLVLSTFIIQQLAQEAQARVSGGTRGQ